jgi:hypothetical protein
MNLHRVHVNILEIVDTLSSPTYRSTLYIACLQSQRRQSLGRPVSTSGMQGALSRAGTLATAKGRAAAGYGHQPWRCHVSLSACAAGLDIPFNRPVCGFRHLPPVSSYAHFPWTILSTAVTIAGNHHGRLKRFNTIHRGARV